MDGHVWIKNLLGLGHGLPNLAGIINILGVNIFLVKISEKIVQQTYTFDLERIAKLLHSHASSIYHVSIVKEFRFP